MIYTFYNKELLKNMLFCIDKFFRPQKSNKIFNSLDLLSHFHRLKPHVFDL